MATDLTGLKVKDTYNSLLKIGDNSSLSATPDKISDGLGNESILYLSTSQVSIGTLPATGYDLTVNSAIKTGSIDIVGAATAATLRLTGGSGSQGTLSWNTDEETVDIIQNGATLQVGQEVQVHVKNQTGSTITDGTPVYVTGTLGSSGRLTVAPMIADGTIEAKYFLGITTEDIPNGEDGKVTTFGKIRGLDTTAYSEGQTLYVSASTAGAFQTTAPVAPNLDLEVAIVINVSANNGTIFVRAQNGHYLGLLHDVYLNNPANNQFLVYNSTTSRWENQGIASVGSINLDTVTDNGNTTTNDIEVGSLTVGGTNSAFNNLKIVAPNASVYYKDSDSSTAWHLGSNGDYFYLLEDTNRNGVWDIVNSRWNTDGYEQYTGHIDNRLGSYKVGGTTVIDSSRNISANDISAGNMTLSGYLRGAANFVIDPAAYGDETGVVQILGDLRVDGTTTTINSTTVTIDDKNLVLASGSATAADANGAGISIDGASANITYNSTDDSFDFNKDVKTSGHYFADTHFRSTDTAATLSTTGAGIVYLRPNGYNQTTGQATLASNGILTLNGRIVTGGEGLTTSGNGSKYIQLGDGRTDDNYAYIDLVGDTTYTDYGLRIIRTNGGQNTSSQIIHRGTGDLQIRNLEAAPIVFKTNDTDRIKINGTGGIDVSTNITFGQGDKIIFPDNTSVPDSPTNEQVDYITFGSNGSISQVSGRGALMITSSDDSLILANGDVGRSFTNANITVGGESIYMLSDGAIEMYSDLQDGWDGSPTPWYRLRYIGNVLTTYDGTNTYTYWNSNDDADFNSLKIGGTTVIDSSRNISLADSVRVRFGDADDFSIYHNGTNTLIDNLTGSLIIRNQANNQDIVLSSDDGNGGLDDYIRVDGSEGSVILYHYGSAKLETTSTGVSVTGALSGNISTSSISGGTIDINGTTAINLQYNGSTQLRVDSTGVAYLGTVTFANDGISLTDDDSTADSFFHANVNYTGGIDGAGRPYDITSNARYGADYIQVDGSNTLSDRRFVISPKDLGFTDEDAMLFLGGDHSSTAPNTLVDWHTIEMNALLVKLNANLNIQTGGLLVGGVSVINSSRNITGNSFIKSGGTSSQFLKADGSVDSNVYATETDSNKITARALGWVPAYSTTDENAVFWNESEQAIELYSATDASIGMALKAVRMKAGDKIRFTTMVKGTFANSDGLYLRLYAYHGDMPDGKTHVSNNATDSVAYVQEDSSGVTNWVENGAITADWVTYEYTYTAPADGYVSLVVLNWVGYSTSRLYVKQPDIQFEKVNQATNAGYATSAGNADTVDTKHATDFTLDYVTDNGATTTNNITIGDGTADNSLVVKHSDNSRVEIHGYGIQMSRGASYIRPTSDASQDLYIGNSGASTDWRYIYFKYDNSIRFNNNGTETFRVDDNTRVVSGNLLVDNRLGIGTTSPARPLHAFQSGDNEVARFESDVLDVYLELKNSTTTNNVLLGSVGDEFKIHTGGAERIRIDSAGSVGIGTTSPSEKLEVVGNIRLNTVGNELQFSNHNVGAYRDLSNRLVLGGYGGIHFNAQGVSGMENQTTRMVITDSGSVGIGTTTPNSNGKTQISGDTTAPSLSSTTPTDVSLIVSNSDINYGTMFATYGSGIGALQQRRTTTNTYYDFLIQPHGGRVAIGKTSASYDLDISGTTRVGTNLVVNGTYRGGSLQVNDYNSNIDGARIYGYSNNEILSLISRYDQADGGLFFKRGDNGSEATIGEINWVSNQFRLNATVGNLAIQTGNSTAITVDSSQRVGIGTTAPSAKLAVSGDTILSAGTDNTTLTISSGNIRQNYLSILYAGKSNTSQFLWNATYNGGQTDTYQPVFSGSSSAGMTVMKMPSGGVGGLQFYVKNHGTTSGDHALSTFTKSFEIFQDGDAYFGAKLGIGDDNPLYKLHIESTDDTLALFKSTDNKGAIRIADDDTNAYVSAENGFASFGHNVGVNAGNININSSGNVGIGTTSITSKLQVDGDFNISNKYIYNQGTVATTGAGVANGSALTWKQGDDTINTAYNYRVRLTTSGTGTNSGATYLVEYDPDTTTYNVRMVSRSGSNSNHPLLAMSGSQMIAYTNHATAYNIQYHTEAISVADNDGTLHNMGADYHWQRDVNNLFYEDGNVGIATDAPSAKLQIGDNTASTLLFYNNDLYNKTKFHGVNSQSGDGVWEFINSGTWNQTRFYVQDANNVDSRLTFRFTGNNGANEILSGTSTGNVGIGTVAPSAKLHVAGDIKSEGPDGGMVMRSWQANASFGMIGTANMSSNEYALLTDGTNTFLSGGANGYVSIRGGNNDTTPVFYVNNSYAYVDNGNFGVGVTTPQHRLVVDGNIAIDGLSGGYKINDITILDNSSTYTRISNPEGAYGLYIGDSADRSNYYDNNYHYFRTAGGSSVLAALNSNGYIIGGTSPSAKLTVDGENNGRGIELKRTGSLSGNAYLRLVGVDTQEALGFSVNNSEKARITYDGKFGIGTDSPSTTLVVRGADSTSDVNDWGFVAFENQQDEGLAFGYDTDGNYSWLYSRERGVSSRGLRLQGSIFIPSYNNNVGIGDTTPSYKLDVNGDINTQSTYLVSGSMLVNTSRRSIFLNSFASGGGEGIFFRDGFTYNCSITAEDHNGSSADGICISGYDGVSFSTGSNSRNERMRVDSSGRLLINATSTSFSDPLYVNGNAYSTGGWRVGTSATYVGQIRNNAGKLSIESDTNRDIQFTDANGGVVMYIDTSTETVGIGTTSPVIKLDVNSSGSDSVARFTSTDSRARILIEDDTDISYFGTYIGTTFIGSDDTPSGNTLNVTSSGNVGIGTTSPLGTLDVNVTGNNRVLRLSRDTGTNGRLDIDFESALTNLESLGSFVFKLGASPNEAMRLTGTGLGIGTTSPSEKLSIASGNISMSDSYAIKWGNNYLTGLDSVDALRLFTAGAERVRIDSAGNVGIGTTTPSASLDVNGVVVSRGGTYNAGTDNYGSVGYVIQEGHFIFTQDGGYLRRLIGKTTGDIIEIGQSGTSLIDGVNFFSGVYCNYNWYNNGSIQMKLHSTGLSILNTNTTYALDVTGTIRASGDVIAYSDARVKENVKTIDNALDKVTKLRGVSYNKIGETEEKIGVIAQEIEKVLPQVVQEDNEGMKSVAYGNIVGVLIEAIKELKDEVNELKSQINGSTK